MSVTSNSYRTFAELAEVFGDIHERNRMEAAHASVYANKEKPISRKQAKLLNKQLMEEFAREDTTIRD